MQLGGHGHLRIAAMGFARRAPDRKELARMQRLMADAMEDGAWGLSTGLIYAPGSYASTEEIVEIARVAGRPRGFYASPTRGEGPPPPPPRGGGVPPGRQGRRSAPWGT